MGVLTDLLAGDALAPVYVIRLWAHCQNKKAWAFPDMSALQFKAVCQGIVAHKPEAFLDAFVTAGYCARDGAGFAVPSWEQLNTQLIAAWTNGARGGRPTGKNPTKTPRLTDKRREEKKEPPAAPIGADAPPAPPPPAAPAPKPKAAPKPPPAPEPPPPPPAPPVEPPAPAPAPVPPAPAPAPAPIPTPAGIDLFGKPTATRKTPAPSAGDFVLPDFIPQDVWNEFLAHRMELSKLNKKAPFTAGAMKGVVSDVKKCMEQGESATDALRRCMAEGWRTPYPKRATPTALFAPRTTRRDEDAARANRLAGRDTPPPPPQGQSHEESRGRHRGTGDVVDVDFREPGSRKA